MKNSFSSLALLCITIAIHASSAVAELEPQIGIVGPANGQAIYDAPGKKPAFYNEDDDTVTVSGLFGDVSDELIAGGDVFISINGSTTPADVAFTGTKTVDGVLYHSGIFSQRVPISFSNYWPLRQYVAEIVYTKTYEALARSQVSVFDLRAEDDTVFNESINTEITGMSAQLTDRGLGNFQANAGEFNLEKTLHSQLPSPSLKSFNETLNSRARAIERSQVPDQHLNRCIDLKKLDEERFRDKSKFKPLKSALSKAKLQFKLYKGAKAGCNLLTTPPAVAACKISVEATFCVKSEPKEKDFKLCVNDLEADVQSLSIDGVTQVGLAFERSTNGNRGLLDSDISLGKSEGLLNIYLRGMQVEWRNELCVDRPKVEVDEEYIEKTQWLDSWATCKNVALKDGSASTVASGSPGSYQIKADQDDTEQPEVTMVSNGIFEFQNSSLNVEKGSCKLPKFVHDDAELLAESFRTPLHQTVNSTWYLGTPHTMEAVELTKIFAAYRLGQAPQNGFDLFASIDTLGSDQVSGLQTYWKNIVSTTDAATLAGQRQRWFYAPERGVKFSSDARDHLGRLFDLSYSITTGLLNRILNMQAAIPGKIDFVYKPTWKDLEEFGVTRPANKSRTSKATLNRKVLTQFDPAFLNIGGRKLEIKITPVLDPIVYMPPDPTAETTIPNVGTVTAYGIDALDIRFKEKDTTVDGNTTTGKTWLHLRGGFVDKDFKLTVVSKKGAKYLKSSLVTDAWDFNIVEKPSVACLLSFSGPIGGPGPCEDRLERSVERLIKKALRIKFQELLSTVPAPQSFDALGESKKTMILSDTHREQVNQYITFYGLFKQ